VEGNGVKLLRCSKHSSLGRFEDKVQQIELEYSYGIIFVMIELIIYLTYFIFYIYSIIFYILYSYRLT
jgi:hypothetical protein